MVEPIEVKFFEHGYARIGIDERGVLEVLGSDRKIAKAAHSTHGIEGAGSDEQVFKFLKGLYRKGHMTPFEKGVIEFNLCAPEVSFRQLIRHRMASCQVLSGRYVDAGEKFYLPSNVQVKPGFRQEEADAFILELKAHYERAIMLYQEALSSGIPREQARLYLPYLALYIEWSMTINVRSLFNLLMQRLEKHAQWETRVVANALLGCFAQVFPMCARIFIQDFNTRYPDQELNLAQES